jgi:hypothetical protein
MLHANPMHNMLHHGLFEYCPSLFASVAQFNDYEMVGQWISTTDPSFWLPASVDAKTLTASARTVMVTLMRRRSPGDFVIPLQIDTPMIVHDTALDRYHIGGFATKSRARPTYDVAFKVDFSNLESRALSIDEVMSTEELRIVSDGGPKSPRVRVRELQGQLKSLNRELAHQREIIQQLEAKVAQRVPS